MAMETIFNIDYIDRPATLVILPTFIYIKLPVCGTVNNGKTKVDVNLDPATNERLEQYAEKRDGEISTRELVSLFFIR